MPSSESNGKWVVSVRPPIPGVRHTEFGPYTEEGAMNFQATVGKNFPMHTFSARPMADRIWGDPLGYVE